MYNIDIVLGLFLVIIVISVIELYRLARRSDASVLDLVTRTDQAGKIRIDPDKFFATGAFLISSWGFYYLIVADKMSEVYFTFYMTLWAGKHYLSIREKYKWRQFLTSSNGHDKSKEGQL